MNRRVAFKEESKCNFCYNWFQVYSEIKFGLNICEECIYKALNTNCFKLPTQQGYLYQVYLARRHISHEPSSQLSLLEKIDEFMHLQIRSMLDRWDQIAKIIYSSLKYKRQEQIIKKVEVILSNDSKKFMSLKNKTIAELNEGLIQKENKYMSTPMRDRNLNQSIKGTNGSIKRKMNRDHSKKSTNQFEENLGRVNDDANDLENNGLSYQHGSERKRNYQYSPSVQSARKSKVTAMDNQMNRDFTTKMQLIKSNITSSLQDRCQQITKSEPLNILRQKIYEAIQNTNCINKCIELVSYNGLQEIDMRCYLSNLKWQGVEVVKFVKVGLSDEQLYDILKFLQDKSVQTLVLTGNNLTEQSCKYLLNCQIKDLKNIYIGKNQIFLCKAKKQIKELKQKYNFYL